MSHRHSFNTQPRKRIRQKNALERWKLRRQKVGACIESASTTADKQFYTNKLENVNGQIGILESKGITI